MTPLGVELGKMCKIIGSLAARAPAHDSSAVTQHRSLCGLLVEAIQRSTQVQGEETDSASWWGTGEVTVLEENMGWGGLVKATFGKPNLPQPPKPKNPKNCTEESVMYTEPPEDRPVRKSFFRWKKVGGAGKSKTSPGINNMMERSERIETTVTQRENLQVQIFSPALI